MTLRTDDARARFEQHSKISLFILHEFGISIMMQAYWLNDYGPFRFVSKTSEISLIYIKGRAPPTALLACSLNDIPVTHKSMQAGVPCIIHPHTLQCRRVRRWCAPALKLIVIFITHFLWAVKSDLLIGNIKRSIGHISFYCSTKWF